MTRSNMSLKKANKDFDIFRRGGSWSSEEMAKGLRWMSLEEPEKVLAAVRNMRKLFEQCEKCFFISLCDMRNQVLGLASFHNWVIDNTLYLDNGQKIKVLGNFGGDMNSWHYPLSRNFKKMYRKECMKSDFFSDYIGFEDLI